jgi:hypothetical protein
MIRRATLDQSDRPWRTWLEAREEGARRRLNGRILQTRRRLIRCPTLTRRRLFRCGRPRAIGKSRRVRIRSPIGANKSTGAQRRLTGALPRPTREHSMRTRKAHKRAIGWIVDCAAALVRATDPSSIARPIGAPSSNVLFSGTRLRPPRAGRFTLARQSGRARSGVPSSIPLSLWPRSASGTRALCVVARQILLSQLRGISFDLHPGAFGWGKLSHERSTRSSSCSVMTRA